MTPRSASSRGRNDARRDATPAEVDVHHLQKALPPPASTRLALHQRCNGGVNRGARRVIRRPERQPKSLRKGRIWREEGARPRGFRTSGHHPVYGTEGQRVRRLDTRTSPRLHHGPGILDFGRVALSGAPPPDTTRGVAGCACRAPSAGTPEPAAPASCRQAPAGGSRRVRLRMGLMTSTQRAHLPSRTRGISAPERITRGDRRDHHLRGTHLPCRLSAPETVSAKRRSRPLAETGARSRSCIGAGRVVVVACQGRSTLSRSAGRKLTLSTRQGGDARCGCEPVGRAERRASRVSLRGLDRARARPGPPLGHGLGRGGARVCARCALRAADNRRRRGRSEPPAASLRASAPRFGRLRGIWPRGAGLACA